MKVKDSTKTVQTLVELHGVAKNSFKAKQEAVLQVTGTKGINSFYDIINGNRKLSPAEKRAVAEIYECQVDEINWQDEKILPESDTKA